MAKIGGIPVQSPSQSFPTLSIRDLLEAREACHVHLMNIRSVVATAIGRFREMPRWKEQATLDPGQWKPREIKEPRTLANSVLTEQSWPCVLVFVNRWYSREELAKGSQNLATLWESASKEGGGAKVPQGKLGAIDTAALRKLYNDKTFAKAMWLDDMVDAEIGIVPE